MADVFISYCRSEGTSELVRRIAGELDDMEISCWYDTQGLNVGEIGDFIKAEIERCKVFLLLLDEGANQSSYVFSEVCASFPLYGKQITPIPVQIGPFAINSGLWFRLSGYNILSCVSSETVPVDELTHKIAELLHKKPQPERKGAQASKTEQAPPQASGRTINIMKSGKCGKDVAYELDENGLLTIYGNGPMGISENNKGCDWLLAVLILLFTVPFMFVPPFAPLGIPLDIRIFLSALLVVIVLYVRHVTVDMFQRPWRNRAYQIFRVVIKDGVTSIVARAFSDCVNLESVSVPENALIESNAFPSWTTVTRRES